MPYPPILRDVNGDPIPQVWDKEIGNWRPVTGDDYGQRVRILGADGRPIDTDNPLYVDGEVQLKGQIVAIGDQAITVSDTAIGLTPPPGATYAVITVEVAAIRFRIRGDTALPTPTEGHIAEVGDDLVLSSPQDIENFRAVVRDGIDAKLFVTYSEVV